MSSCQLSFEQIAVFRADHCRLRDAVLANHVKAVVLLGIGWTPVRDMEPLLMNERTVRTYFQTFTREAIDSSLFYTYVGKEPYLTSEHQKELAEYLDAKLISLIKKIVAYVHKKFKVQFSLRGMTKLIHRLNFVYKKRRMFLLMRIKKRNADLSKSIFNFAKIMMIFILSMTAIRIIITFRVTLGFAKKEKEFKVNSGRKRLNLNTALNLNNRVMEIVYSESVYAQSTFELFNKIMSLHSDTKRRS
ncbi:MAG: winged helix-turn-helix domain-containing protein [Lachnospiraceae bacterium]|nr:winged helix-turn-helix domain-containing protein [Lachnospiraceae bacterium]